VKAVWLLLTRLIAVATFSHRLKTLMTFSRSTYRYGKCSELLEEWEEEAAEVAEVGEVRGMLSTVFIEYIGRSDTGWCGRRLFA
jgi:hypothetical protein